MFAPVWVAAAGCADAPESPVAGSPTPSVGQPPPEGLPELDSRAPAWAVKDAVDDDSASEDPPPPPPEPCAEGPHLPVTLATQLIALDIPEGSTSVAANIGGYPLGRLAPNGLGPWCPRVGGAFAAFCSGEVPPWPPAPSGGVPAGEPSGITLEWTVPEGAGHLALRWAFFSSEYPEWVGSPYADEAIVEIESEAFTGLAAVDVDGGPVTINSAGTRVVSSSVLGPFLGDVGGTLWYESRVPVMPGEPLVLRAGIVSVGDGLWPSCLLMDGIEFGEEFITGLEQVPIGL